LTFKQVVHFVALLSVCIVNLMEIYLLSGFSFYCNLKIDNLLTLMRFFILLFAVLTRSAVQAQHPLVGTWEMVSIKGIGAEGERFSYDTSQVREIKIITPEHYMLMAYTVEGDSLVFNRCYAGSLQLDGNAYIEKPLLSSLPIFENVKSNFFWKVDKDRFIQSGTFTRPDGKTVILDEMVFQKVKTENKYDTNPAIGFWQLQSTSYVNFDGTKGSHTNETRYHVITPSHWMRISHRDGKFQHAMGGSYTMKDGKTYPSIDFSSTFTGPPGKIEATDVVKGDKLHASGMLDAGGTKLTWEDVFQRK